MEAIPSHSSEGSISGTRIFRKNLCDCKYRKDAVYYREESRKKEDLRLDSLCNGCISVGYAKITEY